MAFVKLEVTQGIQGKATSALRGDPRAEDKTSAPSPQISLRVAFSPVVVARKAPGCFSLFTGVLLSSKQLLSLPPLGSACVCMSARVCWTCVHACACACVHPSLSLPLLQSSHERGPVLSRTWLLQGGSDTPPAFFCPDYYFDRRHQHRRRRGSPSSGPPSLLGSRFLLEFAFLPLFYFILFLLTETRARPSSQSQDLLQTSR